MTCYIPSRGLDPTHSVRSCRRLLPVLLVSATIAGCCSQSPPAKQQVATQDQVGKVLVFAQPALPWDTYKALIKTNFTTDAKTMLDAVLPRTAGSLQQNLDAQAIQLQLGLRSSSTSRSTADIATQTVADDSTANTSKHESQSTTTQGPGTTRQKADLLGKLTSGDMPTKADTLEDEPMLKYLAATALTQEVQLLNHYLDGIDNLSTTYSAYVVRFQITFQPRRRDLPYDAYTDIVFSPEGLQRVSVASNGGVIPQYVSPMGATQPSTTSPSTIANPEQPATPSIIVYPMLVTDSLESMLLQRNSDALRQYGLALAGMLNGIGLGADASKTLEKLQYTLANITNSTFTVGRIQEDMIRVRFGAEQIGPDQYALIPRNQFVTVLVLIKREVSSPSLHYYAHTVFSNAIDGSTPDEPNYGQLINGLVHTLKTRGMSDTTLKAFYPAYGLPKAKDVPGGADCPLQKLIDARTDGDFRKFQADVECFRNTNTSDSTSRLVGTWLWGDLAAWRVLAGTSTGQIQIADIPNKPRVLQSTVSLERAKEYIIAHIDLTDADRMQLFDVPQGAKPTTLSLCPGGTTGNFLNCDQIGLAADGRTYDARFRITDFGITKYTLSTDSGLKLLDVTPTSPTNSELGVAGWPELPAGVSEDGQPQGKPSQLALWSIDSKASQVVATLYQTHNLQSAVRINASLSMMDSASGLYPAVSSDILPDGSAVTFRFALPKASLSQDPSQRGDSQTDAQHRASINATTLLVSLDGLPSTSNYNLEEGPSPKVNTPDSPSLVLSSASVSADDPVVGFSFTLPKSPPNPTTPTPKGEKPPAPITVSFQGAVIEKIDVAASTTTKGTASLDSGHIVLTGDSGYVVVTLNGLTADDVTVSLAGRGVAPSEAKHTLKVWRKPKDAQ